MQRERIYTRYTAPIDGFNLLLIIALIGSKAMTGTELKIITPAATEVLGPDVDRLATLHTNARTDTELLKVWLKSHADGSPHTVRVYARVGERFLAALAVAGVDLRKATVEDVQAALEAMRTKEDGSPVKPATVNTYVAAVKSFLGFAHRVGFTRFNAAPADQAEEGPAPGGPADPGRARGAHADPTPPARAATG